MNAPLGRRIAAAGLLAALLAACGPSEATVPTSAPAASPSLAATTASPTPPPASPAASGSPAPVAPGEPTGITLEPVVDGLEDPLDIAVRGRGEDPSMFVAEQAGRVRIVRAGALLDRPFLDVSDRVSAGGERGLLGLAFHPDTTDGRVFVYYSTADARQVVSSFPTDPADPDLALADEEQVILAMDDPFGNHNGGGLAFGPDGQLYISTGDGGGGGDPLGSGRDLGSLLGKILRLDVAGTGSEQAYGIPPDNPFVDDDGARPEIWLTGLRNPFRFRIDRSTGDLWIGDVGQGSREEIDLAPVGVGGLDFGWNIMEGTRCYAAETCDRDGLTLPVTEYGHDQGCSVTGGDVYRGAAQSALTGWYVFADYCSGRFWLLDAERSAADPSTVDPTFAFDSGRNISAIASGPDGELYATDHGAGELLRVVATTD